MLFEFQVWIFLFGGIVSVPQAGMTKQFSTLSVFEPPVSQTKAISIRPTCIPSKELEKSTITTKTGEYRCKCIQIDLYGSSWIIPANETLVKSCKEGTIGNMSWTCGYVNGKCQFHKNQPDYSQCKSLELLSLFQKVDNSEISVLDMWTSIFELTSRPNAYFGHEIFEILDLITFLLDRQDSEMINATIIDVNFSETSYLPLQINTSFLAAKLLDNLISNYAQWEQLFNADLGDEAILKVLEATHDVAFRLSSLAKLENISLRCEISLPNVTLSSSYWDGSLNNQIFGCDLASKNIYPSASEAFLRFPVNNQLKTSQSYTLLPNKILDFERAYMASGVLIAATNLIEQVLPGNNINIPGKMSKSEVNSPLISLILYDPENGESITQLPENTFVQLVHEHNIVAKKPRIRSIRRELEKDEKPSGVPGSAICSYILQNSTSKLSMAPSSNVFSWIWDDRGCQLVSTNKTHTICFCYHLAGFSNSMDFHEYSEPSVAFQITHMVCSITGIIFLILTIILHVVFWSLRTKRTPITLNVCCIFLVNHLLWLLTLDKNVLHLDDKTCAVMGALLHFFLLAGFMWFFIDGLQLYRLVANVFKVLTTSKWTAYWYFALAYLVPFLVVLITELLASFSSIGIIGVYSGDEKCWLVGGIWLWSFLGPFIVLISGGAIFITIVLFSSGNFQQYSSRKNCKKRLARIAYRTMLLCLMIMWTIGFLTYGNTPNVILDYIFEIVKCLQGVLIYVDRVVLNVRIRTAIIDRCKRLKNYIKEEWRGFFDLYCESMESKEGDELNQQQLPIFFINS